MKRLLIAGSLVPVIFLGSAMMGCDAAMSQAIEGALTSASGSLIDSAFQEMLVTPSTYTPTIPTTTSTVPTSPGSLLPQIQVPTMNIPSSSVSSTDQDQNP